jgi:gamma-glutamyltranspeptidase/glutathione hydrolase
MVASTHWLASAAGMAILERGGNAYDAAVAAGFALQVVEPHLNGPGGEVPIIGYGADRDEVFVVDGQGPAPRAATIDHFRSLGIEMIPGAGVLAACVPGAFGAWMLLLGEFGTMRVRDVLETAISFARSGFPLVARISATIAEVEGLFRSAWPTSAEIYLAGGVPAPGTIFRNEALAATFERIVAEAEAASNERDEQIEAARRAYYEGFVAEAIDGFCRSAEGLVTGDDLAGWRSSRERPVATTYGDYEVFKCGPWTQGPVFLQQLALLAGFDLRSMTHGSADHIHTVIECAKLAFADRESFYGDPRFVDVPVDELLDPIYAKKRRALVGDAASFELHPGSPGGREPLLPPLRTGSSTTPGHLAGTGEPTRGDTCHVDVVDRWGNMVAATPSGGWLQSSPAVPGLGFCLGTRAQMFWLDERFPNSLAPGKRPRTTLTPSFAKRDGKPYMAFGTPGGDSQDQWSLNFFLNHADFGMNLQEAIDAPMFHTNHFPSSFYPRAAAPGQIEVESRVDDEVLAELGRRGHDVVVVAPWSLGRLSAVARDGNVLKAAANPRGMQGYAIGR